MARVEIKVQRCPCCGYEYQKRIYYKDVEHEEKEIVSRVRNGKDLATSDVVENAKSCFVFNGYLPEYLRKMCKVITKKVIKKEFDRVEVIKGTEPFKVQSIGSNALVQTDDLPISGEKIGMFCPKCGIFMDYNKCTTTKVEEF